MADKLEWLNRHFVLLRHRTWKDAVQKENDKIRPDLTPLSPEQEKLLTVNTKYINDLSAEKFSDAADGAGKI